MPTSDEPFEPGPHADGDQVDDARVGNGDDGSQMPFARRAMAGRLALVRRTILSSVATTALVAIVYMIAALAVGGLLMYTVNQMEVDLNAFDWRSDESDPLIGDAMARQIVIAYGVAAGLIVAAGGALFFAAATGRPAVLYRLMTDMPWIGPAVATTHAAAWLTEVAIEMQKGQTESGAFATAGHRRKCWKTYSRRASEVFAGGGGAIDAMSDPPGASMPIAAIAASHEITSRGATVQDAALHDTAPRDAAAYYVVVPATDMVADGDWWWGAAAVMHDEATSHHRSVHRYGLPIVMLFSTVVAILPLGYAIGRMPETMRSLMNLSGWGLW